MSESVLEIFREINEEIRRIDDEAKQMKVQANLKDKAIRELIQEIKLRTRLAENYEKKRLNLVEVDLFNGLYQTLDDTKKEGLLQIHEYGKETIRQEKEILLLRSEISKFRIEADELYYQSMVLDDQVITLEAELFNVWSSDEFWTIYQDKEDSDRKRRFIV